MQWEVLAVEGQVLPTGAWQQHPALTNAKQPCLIYLLSHQVLQQHKSADTMVALMKVYEEEDEAYQDLVTMATQFYQYLLQPFRDMRELATLYKLEILVSLPLQSERPSYTVGLQLLLEQFRLKSCNVPCFCLYLFFFPSAKGVSHQT